METGTVGYVCTAAAHRPRASASDVGLTVNNGEWAFCPAGATDGHIWSSVEGASLAELARTATIAARTSNASG